MGNCTIKLKVTTSDAMIGIEERKNLMDVVARSWFTEGKYCEEFSDLLKMFIGKTRNRHIQLVNSGSSANLLALSSLFSPSLGKRRLLPGDEIITVATGFPTTINPIIQLGLQPVFIDIDIPSYNAIVNKVEQAVTDRTKGIFLAHTLGNPFRIDMILMLKHKYGLWLIEDCCDALGSKHHDFHVGNFGDIGTFSFHPAHHITTGEGGAVYTKDDQLAKILRSMNNWGRDCICKPGQNGICGKRYGGQYGTLPDGFDHKYVFSEMGYNFKMTELQAAIGVAQMHKLEGFIEKRKSNFLTMKNSLKDITMFKMPETSDRDGDPSWFGFPITLMHGNRSEVIAKLNEAGIDTRMIFAGNITRHPYMENIAYDIRGGLNNSDYVTENSFWLGIHPKINEEALQYQIHMLKEVSINAM